MQHLRCFSLPSPGPCPGGGCSRGSGEAVLLGETGCLSGPRQAKASAPWANWVPLARERMSSPTWADGLRGSRGRQRGRQAGSTSPKSSRGTSKRVTPSAALFPGNVTFLYRQGLIILAKVGFPLGMEEPQWQHYRFSCEGGVCKDELLSGSSALTTAFRQQSSRRFCLFLLLCVPRNAYGSFYPKKTCLPNGGKRVQGFLQPRRGKKNLPSVFFRIGFNRLIPFSQGCCKSQGCIL